jgi:tight adherence protein B
MTAVAPAALAAMAVWVAAVPPRAALRLRALVGTPVPSTPAVFVRAAGRGVRELRRSRRRPGQRRAAVIELCDGFGAELAAGRSPETALAHAASAADPELRRLLVAAPADGDVATALDRASKLPGAEGLRLLAGCWRIGAERGGSFALVVDGLAAALRDEEAHRAELAAQLAGPRATARLLAVLPLLGLAMAAALGARPVAFLLGTLPGVACLSAGVTLDIAGLWWTRRLAARAEVIR